MVLSAERIGPNMGRQDHVKYMWKLARAQCDRSKRLQEKVGRVDQDQAFEFWILC